MQESYDILFVDDEESVLNSIRRLCRKEDWSIETAVGAEQALDLFERASFSVVVSDMRMPGMDGAELLSLIATKYPEVKQILLTGYSDIDATVKAINNAKISHYIAKPWDNDHLKKVIADVLEESRLREEHAALVLLTEKQNKELRELNEELEAKVAVRTKALREAIVKLNEANVILKSSYASFVRVFSQFIELRDRRLSPTISLTSAHVRLLAERMGLSEDTIDQLTFAAMLRNLGKLTLPDEILDLSFEKMNADQRAAYRKYPEVGQALLLSIENLQEAANIIGEHQERIDGKGYPKYLAGEKISIPAQILGIVSDYHDLINGVLTAAKRSPRKICEYFESQKGKRFNADIVENFLAVLAECEKDDVRHESVAMKARELKPKMILSQDLFTSQGLFLVAKDTTLSQKLIEKMICLEEDSGEEFSLNVYQYSLLKA